MTTAPSLQTVSTGLVVAVVGFFSSFPIVLQGLHGVGANAGQAASGLMAAAVAMGLAGILLSLWTRQPISVAWSTPGVALLAVTPPLEAGFAEAVGAFVLAGVLTAVTGLIRPVGQMAAAIPVHLAHAMLAGVLIWICVVPFQALAQVPETAVPIVATWYVVGRFSRLAAVPAAVIVAAGLTWAGSDVHVPADALAWPVWTMPVLSMAGVLSIALPLFIVTMATQNIPGIAVLRGFGYSPPPGQMFAAVGAASVASAPLGAPATCLAALTAALCAGEDSDRDPARRYWAAVVAGVVSRKWWKFAGGVIS